MATLTERDRQVLAILADGRFYPATAQAIRVQMLTQHGVDLSTASVRAVAKRLVDAGYARRHSLPKQTDYTSTVMGRGYLSVEET